MANVKKLIDLQRMLFVFKDSFFSARNSRVYMALNWKHSRISAIASDLKGLPSG
jgi:hypothetical protein